MQHSLKDDYASCIKNYTNQFKENSFRKLACNDFKSWPGPREETWRLSRLGTLSRKKIKPITPNLQKSINGKSKHIGSKIIKFVDGAYRGDLSSEMPLGVSM